MAGRVAGLRPRVSARLHCNPAGTSMAPRREAMRPGDVIAGKYEVERVLGEGGMGLVVAARHRTHGTTVAIKVLKEGIDDDTIRRRFLREARGARQLHSEHVARMMDYGLLDDGRPYLVMEMLDGPDLQTVVDQQPIPQDIAVAFVHQACLGLADAHALGIVHRDIKPANLMLSISHSTGAQVVKVVDFGIATASRNDIDGNLTGAYMVLGSVTYMSPEQLRSSPDLDHRSDVWSLGVTLYEMISQRVPFPGDTWAAVACAIASEPHDPLVEADPRIAAIVDRCLAKDPADRFANVGELAAALTRLGERHASQMPIAMPTMTPAQPLPVIPSLVSSSGVPNEVHIFRTEKMRRVPRPRAWTRLLLAASLAVMALVVFAVVDNLPVAANAASVPLAPAPVVKPIVEPKIEPVAREALPEAAMEQPIEIELPPQSMAQKSVRARTGKKPLKIARRR
ncbi:MAG TPA: serine/threonine-protein kinase [Kofleriaceae bacterium]